MNCGPMSETLADTTEDAFLDGQLRLRQPRSGHRAGHDAMLLAAATAVNGRAIAWWNSAPGSAPPDLRWPGASTASIWCWWRSMPNSLSLRGRMPAATRLQPMLLRST